jgi:tetratricopeptide (TPR) repeat protein
MHAYDAKDLERLFGLPASAVRTLARAGTIHPVKRLGRLHYSFHDLVVLRTASALRAARVSPRRINRTLQQLREVLPSGSALNSVSLTALGNRIAIREGQALREADSGQYALALDIVEEKGTLRVITRPEPRADKRNTANGAYRADADFSPMEHYVRGLETEESDEPTARVAYEACLRGEPGHVEARLNLGRLLHLAGELKEAEALYRGAFRPDPLIAFNLAVVLEDLNREPEAITAYRSALAMDPNCLDAHYNLARLYARAQNPKASLRHLLAYRRMMDQDIPQ